MNKNSCYDDLFDDPALKSKEVKEMAKQQSEYYKGEWLTYADYSGEISAVVSKGKGKTLVGICFMNQDNKNAEANANRIVKAVNCHDDLYEALKDATGYIKNLTLFLGGDTNGDGIQRMDKALAKAERLQAEGK